MSRSVESSGSEVDGELVGGELVDGELIGGSMDVVDVVVAAASVEVDVDASVVGSVAGGCACGIELTAPFGPSDVHANGSQHVTMTTDARAHPRIMRAR